MSVGKGHLDGQKKPIQTMLTEKKKKATRPFVHLVSFGGN